MPVHYQTGAPGIPGINDPGPSSHPRGPPNLGQLSAVATMQAAPSQQQQAQQQAAQQQQGLPPPGGAHGDDGGADGNMSSGSPSGKEGGEGEGGQASASAPTGGRRGGRTAAMGSDEWSRQRKDNHVRIYFLNLFLKMLTAGQKEVERRRRGNINEGINELGRIVPSGSGEKAKGAILSRAVQYIHHLKENEARNIEKSRLLYDCIDASGLYENRVSPDDRSRMNVPFFLKDTRLDKPFLSGAQERGLLQLKGHRSVGGMRASIYNAMPLEGVQALVDYMREFERERS